MFHNFFS